LGALPGTATVGTIADATLLAAPGGKEDDMAAAAAATCSNIFCLFFILILLPLLGLPSSAIYLYRVSFYDVCLHWSVTCKKRQQQWLYLHWLLGQCQNR